MVDIGGEVRTQGVNGNDKPWRIAIEKPANDGTTQSVQLIIEPGDNSIATSGIIVTILKKMASVFLIRLILQQVAQSNITLLLLP